jgi:predicted O-methyltransferase YrrM
MKHFDLSSLTDPSSLLRLRDGIYAADLFIAAVAHLNFFSCLDKKPTGMKEICSSLQIKERPADVMLTLFKALNLIEEKSGVFHLTQLSKEYLTESSPWYLGPYISSMKERPICHEMLNVLKSGKPANWGSKKDEQEWALAMEKDDFAETFTAAMDCRGAYLASFLGQKVDLSGYKKLLDIAGGSGIYAATIVSQQPHLCATVLEKAPVDRIVQHSINKKNVADKVNVLGADMFESDLPKGFDVHLFSNVLHDWDFTEVKELLENSYRNLEPGGMIMIHDAFINAEKTGPLSVAEYSVLLMFATEGKCYSTLELEVLLKEIGFDEISYSPTAANRGVILGKR